MPHVTMSATLAKPIASSVRPRSAGAKISRTGFDASVDGHGVLPALGFRHEKADQKRQQRRRRADEHDPAPRILRDVEDHPDDRDQAVAEIRRRADEPGHQRALVRRPAFHDQRDAERPFAAHPERAEKTQRAELPRFVGEIGEPGEDRIGEDAPASSRARARCDRRASQRPARPPPRRCRNSAVMRPIHCWTNCSPTMPAAACISWSAGRATSGKMPISMPSNIQPRKRREQREAELFLGGHRRVHRG